MLSHLPGWHATSVELPGHGQAPDWDARGDYGDQALQTVREAVGAGADVVVGHSFGAVTALRMALERPGAIGRLVLIEPVLFAATRGLPVHDETDLAFKPYIRALAAGDRMAAAAAFTGIWGTGRPFDSLAPAQRAALAARIHLIPAGAPTLHDDRAGILAPGRLEGLTVPVDLLEGAESPAVIDAIHSVLAARLPRAERHSVAGAGHMLPITHPAEVAAILRRQPVARAKTAAT